ncbi:barren [Carabus blaptoides fortunei]
MKNPKMPTLPLRNPLVNLNNSRANGTPLRRSLSMASTSVMREPPNNDEAERMQRRNIVEIQGRISSIGLNRSMTGDNSELSVSKMQDHFEQCVRLFAENKINSKNAWNLQIIEYMRKLLDRDQFQMGDSLQIASTSLDIGSKVYGLRVDDIHNEIMKLASNMARINMEHDESADNVDEGPASDNEAAAAQQKKKRKKRPSIGDENSQLVTNEDSITGNLPTSMFYNRQESGSQRLYTLSALQTLKSGDEQLVSCRCKVPYWSALAESINVRPVSGLVAVTIPPANGTICPSFTDFSVDEWSPEDDLDISHAPPHVEEVVYDENGFPVPELDKSLNNFDDAGEDHLDDVEEEFAGEAHAAINQEVAHITDMRPGSVSGRLEYSYREPPVISERYMLTGVWAGPSHWKVKCIQRTATATIVKSARPVRKRAPRAPPTPINFDLTDKELKELANVNKGRFIKPLQDVNRITYPEDMKIIKSDICTLFLKPDMLVSLPETPLEDVLPLDQDITNYEFDNPNDAEYCNETLHGDALHADSDDNDGEPPADVDNNETCFMDDNMVNMPNLVQKSHVAYATQAKKVDMKKLKKAIIRAVARLDVQNVGMHDDDLENCKISKVSFCKMYDALPNELNSRMAEEASCW